MNSYSWQIFQESQCALFFKALSDNTRNDFSGHYKKHQVDTEEKQKLVPGSEMRRKYVVKKKRGYKKRGKISLLGEVVKVWKCSKHPTKLPLYWLKSINLFLTVKILSNPVSMKLHNGLAIKSIERKVNKIALSTH